VFISQAKENLGVGEDAARAVDQARAAAAKVTRALRDRVSEATKKGQGGRGVGAAGVTALPRGLGSKTASEHRNGCVRRRKGVKERRREPRGGRRRSEACRD